MAWRLPGFAGRNDKDVESGQGRQFECARQQAIGGGQGTPGSNLSGTFTTAANSLSFAAGVDKITYTILTGPANGSGLTSKELCRSMGTTGTCLRSRGNC